MDSAARSVSVPVLVMMATSITVSRNNCFVFCVNKNLSHFRQLFVKNETPSFYIIGIEMGRNIGAGATIRGLNTKIQAAVKIKIQQTHQSISRRKHHAFPTSTDKLNRLPSMSIDHLYAIPSEKIRSTFTQQNENFKPIINCLPFCLTHSPFTKSVRSTVCTSGDGKLAF